MRFLTDSGDGKSDTQGEQSIQQITQGEEIVPSTNRYIHSIYSTWLFGDSERTHANSNIE